MHRTFVFAALISFVFASHSQPAHAGILSKLFGELFSSAGSKTANEAAQAAARQADEVVPAPKSRGEDPALEAGRFIVEEAVGDALKDGYSRSTDNDRSQQDPY